MHWHEGLFLQPHHLQQWQREQETQIQAERTLCMPYPYGVIHMRLNTLALSQWRVQFEELVAIMPSGRVIQWQGNANLPTLDVKPLFKADQEKLTIYLSVPLWFPQQRNAPKDIHCAHEDSVLYSVEDKTVYDENLGENPKALLMRNINAKLITNDQDNANLEVIPVLQLNRSLSEDEALPKVNAAFIPPLLVISGSATLIEMLQRLKTLVEIHRERLVAQMNRAGFQVQEMRHRQLEMCMRLQILNSLHAKVPELLAASHAVTPIHLYTVLKDAMATFAALYPKRDQELWCKAYNHQNPSECLHQLFSQLFQMIEVGGTESYMRIPFEKKNEIGWCANLEESHFPESGVYYLGIRTGMELDELTSLIENRDRFKLMEQDMANSAIFGIRLTAVTNPPPILPGHPNLYYYRLVTSENPNMWELIRENKAIAIKWDGWELADFDLSLYITQTN